MRCKNCDYPLWNLRARQCPECGSPFVPSEFEFVVNSTRFCCPNCDQAYYGTGVFGHLVPSEFVCVQCSQQITMNQMVLRPAEGVTEQQTQVDRMPWLERAHYGWFKRFWLTVFGSMFNPVHIMRAVPMENSSGPAWSFAIQCFAIFLLLGVGLFFGVIGLIDMLTGGGGSLEPFLFAGGGVIGGLVSMLIVILLWTGAAHVLLRMTGPVTAGIGRTCQAICYSSGAMCVLAVPCLGVYCGQFIGGLWWIISATLMLAEAQKVRGGRAAFATITPAVVTFGLTIGIMMLTIYTAAGRMNAMNAGFGTPNWETQIMTQSVLSYAGMRNGQGPPHAAQLAVDSFMASNSFIALASGSDPTKLPVADTTLDQFGQLPPNRMKAAAKAAAANLPANPIAHRLGDFVFTYHGIDLSNPDPGLWVVIFTPEPGAAAAPTVATPVVGLANGTVQRISGSMQSALAGQNALRASSGLPPLPDPSTVTHTAPAAAAAPFGSAIAEPADE